MAERMKRNREERRSNGNPGQQRGEPMPGFEKEREEAGFDQRQPPHNPKAQDKFPRADARILVIGGGAYTPSSHRQIKNLTRALAAVSPELESMASLEWANVPISFDQRDKPRNMAGMGELPLVVSPIIGNVQVGRVLVDDGAGLNLLALEVFQKLQLKVKDLKPSCPFYGVLPGKGESWGQIQLMVTFGEPDNYRMEPVIFDVAEYSLPYNAILGRPALAKFMAVTHVAYMMVKMSGPAGVITVKADTLGVAMCTEQLGLMAAEVNGGKLPGSDPGTLISRDIPESSQHAEKRARIQVEDKVPVKQLQLGEDPA